MPRLWHTHRHTNKHRENNNCKECLHEFSAKMWIHYLTTAYRYLSSRIAISTSKKVRLSPNGINLGLFQIRFQNIFPGFHLFGTNPTLLGPKSETPAPCWYADQHSPRAPFVFIGFIQTSVKRSSARLLWTLMSGFFQTYITTGNYILGIPRG